MKGLILIGILSFSLASAFANEGNGAFEARLFAIQEKVIGEAPVAQAPQDMAATSADCDLPKC